jgi:GrpB-like predicted nucleotidyltransferase (UPF0157 family)
MSAQLPDEPIVLADYEPAWPALFDAERACVAPAVAAFAVAIEHVGSTSVPGLCAKPIIDTAVTVEQFGPPERYIPALEPLGYRFFAHPDNTARHAFGIRDAQGRRPVPGYNLHIIEQGGSDHRRMIAFRDYLRTHPDARDAYCALKRRLAAVHGSDRSAYTEAKTAFVRDIEARAGVV